MKKGIERFGMNLKYGGLLDPIRLSEKADSVGVFFIVGDVDDFRMVVVHWVVDGVVGE